MPNLHGNLTVWKCGEDIATKNGVFTNSSAVTEPTSGHIDGTHQSSLYINFDASQYNNIYGNSTTVQPPALTTNYVIKY